MSVLTEPLPTVLFLLASRLNMFGCGEPEVQVS